MFCFDAFSSRGPVSTSLENAKAHGFRMKHSSEAKSTFPSVRVSQIESGLIPIFSQPTLKGIKDEIVHGDCRNRIHARLGPNRGCGGKLFVLEGNVRQARQLLQSELSAAV
jgi:hypothetical protein